MKKIKLIKFIQIIFWLNTQIAKNIEKEFEYLIEAKKQYHSLKIKAFKQETNYYFNLLPKL